MNMNASVSLGDICYGNNPIEDNDERSIGFPGGDISGDIPILMPKR